MEEECKVEDVIPEYHFGTKYKRTLDSDEEDDEVGAEKYNVLDTNEIEGTEKATVDFDGEIKITPFNMDEELETGHFDKEGTYIFEKNNDIHDNWLDNIDWAKVKGKNTNDNDDDNSEDEGATAQKNEFDINEFYRKLLQLLQPSESIQKAIQRYGKSIKRVKKGQKWKKTQAESMEDENETESKENMMKLIALADQIQTETGDMEIYEKKYEQIQLHLKKVDEKAFPVNDMFSEDFEVQESVSSTSTAKQSTFSNEVLWEYKWENKDDAQIYGPFSSIQMLEWSNQGHFEKAIFVRKKGCEDVQFYTSKRIDFELYI